VAPTDPQPASPAARANGPVEAIVRPATETRLVPTEAVTPLPQVRPKPVPAKLKSMPLTGTYVGALDDQKRLTLPKALRDQLAEEMVLVSPGSDVCLWLTTTSHLDRLNERFEQARVREADVKVFRRLYFAQAEKVIVNGEGRLVLPERLVQFAGLDREVVLVGVDDHVEVWDAARWRRYTQEKSAAAGHE
jgi:MraZ protein